MQIRDMVREDIRNLVPYEPHPYADVIKLDANENPHAFPAPVIKDIFETLTGDVFTRYPDPLGEELRGEIGKMTGAAPENIILGNGSDELIQLLLQTFGGPGRRVVIPVPTFAMYKIHGQITGTEPVEIPRNSDFSLDEERLIAEMQVSGATTTFIATPNNPTGTIAPVEQVRRLLERVDSLVIIDEAYIDFGGQTCLPLIREYPNLVVLRTFSKVALAGLRLGYLTADAAVVRELLKVKQPYNVNGFSQAAARAVLKNWQYFREQIAEIVAERVRLEAELGKIKGIEVFPSKANFVLFRVPVPAAELHRGLLENGVLVRKNPGRTHGLEQCLRATVGTRQENDFFLEKLTKLIPIS
ncbi:histidinol-phosphate transaminase [Phosphitispora fastidiosa]|uniref:histidinol-phosphate transaminase n=1 Tax=Phosphitispora fastidiosa TaxID=2837202 RepID=UPI001E338B6D|nr:histidinol-phosphate transaminase [Phosphitispora fastidiosa]MBU7008532.1 histidinol-phosphate aminotransferase [Phosphitispora fastidiosa]